MGKRGTATATGLLDSRGSSGSARADSVDVPWQQFGDPIDGVIGDAGKHVAQVGFGVEAVQFAVSISVYMAAARSPPLSERRRANSFCPEPGAGCQSGISWARP